MIPSLAENFIRTSVSRKTSLPLNECHLRCPAPTNSLYFDSQPHPRVLRNYLSDHVLGFDLLSRLVVHPMVQGFTLLGIHLIPKQAATPVLVNEDSFRFLLPKRSSESEPDSCNCVRGYPWTNHLFTRNPIRDWTLSWQDC